MKKKDKIIIAAAIVATAVTGLASHFEVNSVIRFILAAVALVLLAMNVGHATDQLGSRLGPGATGVLQSALGNLPELFVCIFALQAGLDKVVQAALVGSILANSLLVFGLALLFGGLKNGKQKFHSEPPKMIATLMLIAFAALAIPTLAHHIHSAAAAHINALNVMVAIVLLLVFAASLTFSIRGDKTIVPEEPAEVEAEHKSHGAWSMPVTLIVLAGAGVGAAFVSEWFVDALQPAMKTLGINEVLP